MSTLENHIQSKVDLFGTKTVKSKIGVEDVLVKTKTFLAENNVPEDCVKICYQQVGEQSWDVSLRVKE